MKINKGFRQGCTFTDVINIYIYIYIYHIIAEWKEEEAKGIKISRNKNIKTLLFADDQVTVVDSEDVLQISIQNLQTFTSEYGLKISTSKTKTMTFIAIDPVRSKTVINNNILEDTNTFSYSSCSTSSQNGKHITVKISELLKIAGIINRTLKPSQVQGTEIG